ncbi:MAG: hypothetical protein GY757_24310, partial [bacterium]|nr:hypothetical protein [bacterium]
MKRLFMVICLLLAGCSALFARQDPAAQTYTRTGGDAKGSQPYTITSVTLTSPNGGESWDIGSSQTISWTSTGAWRDTVRLEYSINNGAAWNTIALPTSASGLYRWIVPNAESTQCLVRVSGTSGTPSDTSNSVFSIVVAPTLTVTSPNGGESWLHGENRAITWTSTDMLANVQIHYSVNNGSSWASIVNDTANDGSYSWTIPDESSTTCLVRVSDSDGSPSDTSNAVFTIVPPTLTVTSPNGGESWHHGENRDITWTTTGSVDSLQIQYSLNNGASWSSITNNTVNDGSYFWTIPGVSSTTCLIRVREVDGSASDTSNAEFTIAPPILTVTTPNGGEFWSVGACRDITWTTAGAVGNVKIEYSTDSGTNWNPVTSSTSNDGRYSWTIPGTTSSNCLVRVSEIDGLPYDDSDAVFTISSSSSSALTVTAPNGGESWESGSSQTITWTSTGTVGNVKIEYSTNCGTTWNPITSSTSNDGIYSWSVPATSSANSLVRVSETDGLSYDDSDAVFAISSSSSSALTVTAPNGGESWGAGSLQTITWTSTGTVGTVKIEYSTDSG